MTNKETGGPAFPQAIPEEDESTTYWHGLDVRDYFAAKAMQALLSCASWRENLDGENRTPSEFTAFSAYEMADAMLKAREQ